MSAGIKTIDNLKKGGAMVKEGLEQDAYDLGSKVNLERSMPSDGRFGGHLVQGHVDACVTIVNIIKERDDNIFNFNKLFSRNDNGSALDGAI